MTDVRVFPPEGPTTPHRCDLPPPDVEPGEDGLPREVFRTRAGDAVVARLHVDTIAWCPVCCTGWVCDAAGADFYGIGWRRIRRWPFDRAHRRRLQAHIRVQVEGAPVRPPPPGYGYRGQHKPRARGEVRASTSPPKPPPGPAGVSRPVMPTHPGIEP